MDNSSDNVVSHAAVSVAAGYAAHDARGAHESVASAVSWAAVIGGAFVAGALWVGLVALGAGLGLSSVSPWANAGASATTMSVATIAWLIVTQIIACSMGGYLAGRLRTKWVDLHTDEVFFRDTAHGFLVWAVGLVISASFLASAATSIMGGAAQGGAAGAVIAGGAAATAAAANSRTDARPGVMDGNAYFVDMLFRTDAANTAASNVNTSTTGADSNSAARPEVNRIFARGLVQPTFPAEDQSYLARQVAARTGLPQPEADKRVADTIAKAKDAEAKARQAADQARKAAAHASLWMFLSILIGAFCASYAATIGGRQRDRVMV